MSAKGVKIEAEKVKSCEITVMFKKEAINTHTLEPMYAFFVQTIKFSIDRNIKYKTWSLTKLSNQKVFLHDSFDMTQELEPCIDIDGVTITRLKPKRISRKKALELIASGTPLFDTAKLNSQTVSHVRVLKR